MSIINYNEYLRIIFTNNFVSIENTAIGSNSGQGNVLNLVNNLNKDEINILKKDSNNVLNEYTYPNLDKFDIIFLTSDTIFSYNKYMHIDTGIEFITREKELIENNVDLSKFEKYDRLTSEELKSCITKLISKYPSKNTFFLKCIK